MQNQKLISVIVPCYNVEKYLRKCLDTIVNQTYKNIEIILIDDGSTDDCPKICDEYSNVDERIRVLHIKNAGISHARNLGIKEANGYYVTFVDSDDYIDDNMYERMMLQISDQQEPDIISSGYYSETENEFVFDISMKNNTKVNYFSREEAFNEIFFGVIGATVWNKLFKTDFLINNKLFFDEDIYSGEDLLFICQAINVSNMVIHLNEDFYHYIKRSTSATNGKFNEKLLTIIEAYDKVDKLTKNNFENSSMAVEKGKILTYCGLIYKMYGNEKYSNKINDLCKYVKKNGKSVLSEKKIKFKEKVLIWIFSKNVFLGCFSWNLYKLFVNMKRKKL